VLADLAIKRSVVHDRRLDCILPCTLKLLDLPVLQASLKFIHFSSELIEACQYTYLISYTKTISSVKNPWKMEKIHLFNIQFIMLCIIEKLSFLIILSLLDFKHNTPT